MKVKQSIFCLGLAFLAAALFCVQDAWAQESLEIFFTPEQMEEFNQLTPEEQAEFLKEAVQNMPSSVGAPTETIEGVVNCFDYYEFGSVQVDVDSEIVQTVSGIPFTVTGNVVNNNPYPIVDGAVYAKVFKKQDIQAGEHFNGHLVIDQFFVAEDISLPANGEKPISFIWEIPAYLPTGDYQMAFFFVSAKKFNLLGLSFTDDVVGNKVNFSVSGEQRVTVEFDKNTVKVDDQDYRFAAFIPQLDKEKEIPVKVDLKNTTNQTQPIAIIWKLYSWDGLLEENLIDTKRENIVIGAGQTKELTYTVTDTSHPVYFLVVKAKYQDTKSILDIRFARKEIDQTRINFPAVTSYPLVKGQSNTLFSCLHNSGIGSLVENNKLVLTLKNQKGKKIHSYVYQGGVSGAMMAVKDEFVPKKNYDSFVLEAELYTDGQLVDSAKMEYDCQAIGQSVCSEEPTGKGLIIFLAILILIIIVIAIVRLKKGGNLAVILLAVLFSIVLLAGIGIDKVEAKTATVSQSYFGELYVQLAAWGAFGHDYSFQAKGELLNPSGQIFYEARVYNDTEGVYLSDGGSIDVGDQLSFVKTDHIDSHISWNGTGYVLDTPFGRWISGAADPGVACDMWDYLGIAASPVNPDFLKQIYIPFSVIPPAFSITHSGTAELSCNADNSVCTVTSPGTINSSMAFSATYGRFYFREADVDYNPALAGTTYSCVVCSCIDPTGALCAFLPSGYNPDEYFTCEASECNYDAKCWAADEPMITGNVIGGTETCYPVDVIFYNPYTGLPESITQLVCTKEIGSLEIYNMDFPAATIVYSLTAIPGGNNPPNPPTINGPSIGCVDETWSFTISGADPDGDQVRYGIDWNNNGTVDQWTGYVNSGTSQSVSRIWTTSGIKTFQALTNDGSANSDWTSHSITIEDCTDPLCDNNLDCDDGDSCTTDTCYNPGTMSAFCSNTSVACIDSDGCCPTGCSVANDNDCDVVCGDGICSDSEDCNSCPPDCGVCPVGPVTVDISANPSLINSGESSTLSWSSNGVSCEASGVTASWSGSKPASGSESTGPLTFGVTYWITCYGADGSVASDFATVDLISSGFEVWLTAFPTEVPLNTASTLTWHCNNATDDTICVTSVADDWNGYYESSGSESTGPLTEIRQYTYCLTCYKNGDWDNPDEDVDVDCAWVNVTEEEDPELSLNFSVNPDSGNVVLDSTLTAQVSGGNPLYTINYSFYCDCDDPSTVIDACTRDHESGATLDESYSYDCTYDSDGTYSAKVIIEKGSEALADIETITVINPDPIVTIPPGDPGTHSNVDYCQPSPWSRLVLSWVFNDPGDTQAAYRIQINRAGGGYCDTDWRDGDASSITAQELNDNYCGAGFIDYSASQPYEWRVGVRDSLGGEDWSDWATFTTPLHRYPSSDFSWVPTSPRTKETTEFRDETVCYNSSCVAWSWYIPDADYISDTSSSSQNPLVEFTSMGDKGVGVKVTDSDGYQCLCDIKIIGIKWSLPGWREITPF